MGVEKYLLEKGVDQEDISKSKKEIATVPGKKYYYDEKAELQDVLVPLAMVKGVSRMEQLSWFDMLNYGSTCLPEGISSGEFNLSTDRFLNVLKWLDENDLNETRNRFINTGNIHFDCFKNGDKEEYYQHTDGNHRVITAKVLGIDEIRARRVYVYEYNAEKHKSYKIYKEREKKAQEIVEELGLEFDYGNRVILHTEDYYELVYQFTYDEHSLGHDFSRIDTMIAEMDELLNRLNTIKEKIDKYYRIYKILPDGTRKFIKKIIPEDAKETTIAHIIALNKVAAEKVK